MCIKLRAWLSLITAMCLVRCNSSTKWRGCYDGIWRCFSPLPTPAFPYIIPEAQRCLVPDFKYPSAPFPVQSSCCICWDLTAYPPVQEPVRADVTPALLRLNASLVWNFQVGLCVIGEVLIFLYIYSHFRQNAEWVTHTPETACDKKANTWNREKRNVLNKLNTNQCPIRAPCIHH